MKRGIYPYRGSGAPFRGGKNLVNQALVLSSEGAAYGIDAGALENNPRQGILLVERENMDTCANPTGTGTFRRSYETPLQQGAVTLTKIEGNIVVFSIADGDTGRFNVVTEQFLGRDGQPTPARPTPKAP